MRSYTYSTSTIAGTPTGADKAPADHEGKNHRGERPVAESEHIGPPRSTCPSAMSVGKTGSVKTGGRVAPDRGYKDTQIRRDQDFRGVRSSRLGSTWPFAL